MPTVTVFYGHAYDGKNDAAFARCLERLRQNKGHTCLYLARSDVRVRQLREHVLRELSGCFHWPVTTFPDCIASLYRNWPGAKPILSALEQKLLIEELLAESERARGGRFAFHRFRDYPGIVAKISALLAELRRAGITSSQELQTRLNGPTERRRHFHDELLTIFDHYCARLEAAQVLDENGIFLEIARQAQSAPLDLRGVVTAPELLVLEGYYELTRPGQQIFSALCDQFDQTIITLDTPLNPYDFPPEADTPKPFRIFRDMADYLRSSGFSVREFQDHRQDAKTPSQEKQLDFFASSRLRSEFSETFSVKAYRDRKEEVMEIARAIRRLYRDGAITTLREVGVTFPVLEPYERLVREIFPLFGLPFTMFQGYALAAAPVVVTLMRVLQAALDDYSREALSKLFASPLVQYEIPDAPPLNADTYLALDSLARELGIVGGKTEWETKLATARQDSRSDAPASERAMNLPVSALLHFLEFLDGCHGEESSTKPSRSPGEIASSKTPRHDMVLSENVTALLPGGETHPQPLPGGEFEASPLRAELSAWIAWLKEAMHRLQIPHRVLRSPDRHIRERDVTALRKFLRLLDTLERTLRQYPNGAQPQTLALREFFDLLQITVQGESYYPPEQLADSVFVMGRLDTRQVQCRHLFFGGLVDKDVPGQAEPNIFLSDQEAEMLGLPTYTKKIQEADYLFDLNARNPTAQLWLSYPQQEGDTELLKSMYVDRLLRPQEQAQQESIAPEPADVPAPEPDLSPLSDPRHIFTYTELYQWIGTQRQHRHAGQDGDVEEALRLIAATQGPERVANFLTGLAAQRSRRSPTLGRFDGVLTSTWAKADLSQRYARHVYRTGEFEQYVRCPMKFFFHRVLRLNPLPELTNEVSALTRSALLHKIVYRFYAVLAAETPADARAGNVDREFLERKADRTPWLREAQHRMAQIAQEELTACQGAGVFWQQVRDELLIGLETNGGQPDVRDTSKKQGVLAKFIEHEALRADTLQPAYLKAAYGMTPAEGSGYLLSERPYRFTAHDARGETLTIPLKGEIDRLDLEPDVSAEVCHVVLYDYKTGGIPPMQDMRDGLAFDLPLQMLAVQDGLGERYQVVASGYYQLRSPAEIGPKGLLGSKEHAEQRYFSGSERSLLETYQDVLNLLETYKTRAVQVVQAIRGGRFHPTTLGKRKAWCDYCDYARICRVDHQRMRT